MTDDLDPFRLLASAALDNEVDADERVRVEASPALRSQLETYRSIASALTDVEIPESGRESAIAAALAVFDELYAPAVANTAAVARAATVVSLQARRQRQYLLMGRVAGGIAAAAVVAVIGVATFNSTSGDEKRSSDTIAALDQSTATVSKSAPEADAALTSTAVETAPNIASAAGGAPATETAAEAAAMAVDPWATAPSFINAEELRVAADTIFALTSPAAPESTVASTPACAAPANSNVVAVIFSGQRVYVVRNDAAGVLQVLDPDDCAEIVTIPIG